MAISTRDGLIAASKVIRPHYKTTTRTTVAGGWFSMYSDAGNPGAGVLAGHETTPAANTAGRIQTPSLAGSAYPNIPFSSNRTYLTRLTASNTVVSQIALYDCIWVGSAYAFNANVTVTSPSWAARVSYNGGAADYNGLEIWVECVTGGGTGNQAFNVSYNDQGGAGGSTGAVGISAVPTVGRTWQLPLAAGDSGLQAITNVTGSVATVAGTYNILVLRPLARIYIPVANQTIVLNYADLGMPELFNDSSLYWMVMAPSGTSSGVPWVEYQLSNG